MAETNSRVLTDLPVEILRKILSFLEKGELIVLADVNQLMRNIVKTDVELESVVRSVAFGSIDSEGTSTQMLLNHIEIYGLRLILRFIRIFGEEIEILFISNKGAYEQMCLRVMRQVEKYATNVRVLGLHDVCYDLSRGFSRSFKTVKELTFKRCTISRSLCSISLHFPNLEKLRFFSVNCFESTSRIMNVYPNLREIFIAEDTMVLEQVVKFSELNSRVRVFYPWGKN